MTTAKQQPGRQPGRMLTNVLIGVFAIQFAVTALSWVGDLTSAGGIWDNGVLVSLAILASLVLFPVVVVMGILSFRKSRKGRIVSAVAGIGLLLEIVVLCEQFIASR